jgi:hypothetical protein
MIISCSDKPKKANPDTNNTLPKAQIQIQELINEFKSSVKDVKDLKLKDSIRIQYSVRIFDLLSSIYLDSIKVHIDTVVIDNLTVTTKSHCNNEIVFSGSLTFFKKMDPRADSFFIFMKGLQPGADTTVNFIYNGSHKLRVPSNTGEPILEISAFPAPIWMLPKN